MINLIKSEAIIINFNEYSNGDLFLVFMVRRRGFLKGIVNAEMRRITGAVSRFHYADVSFFDLNDGSGLMGITELKMKEKAKESEPAF